MSVCVSSDVGDLELSLMSSKAVVAGFKKCSRVRWTSLEVSVGEGAHFVGLGSSCLNSLH